MSRKKEKEEESGGVSRRGFLKGASFAVAAVGAGSIPTAGQDEKAKGENVTVVSGDDIAVDFTLNGQKVKTKTSPNKTLLDLLRNDLDMTGTKRVCDRGSCGACTVLIDGKSACSCSYLAIDANGRSIQTVEGLATGDELCSLQKNFISCDALQCGFCTPGMLMSSHALLQSNPKPNREQIAAGISGNLCRCGTYQNIFEAVEKTAKGGGK